MEGRKILVIDDDKQMCELLVHTFSLEKAQVYTVTDSRKAMREFYTCQPDLVFLDIMMPEVDGWELCRQIRQLSDVPIIMLSALHRPKQIIQALEYGADDYVTKPFHPEVLLVRAYAVLRRSTNLSSTAASPLSADDHLSIDLENRRILVEGELIKLSATEFRLLEYLCRHAGRVRTYSQILQNVWGSEYRDSIEYVHVYIHKLRQKLEGDASKPVYLLTEHGVGYRFA